MASELARPGERNGRWLGDDARYTAIHKWLRENFVKRRCYVCGAGSDDRRLEWALIPGRGRPFRHGDGYAMASRDVADYAVCCCSCHARYANERKGTVPCMS